MNTVSDIAETPFGYHLITVTERKELQTLQEQYDALKQQVANLPRTKAAETELARELRSEYGARLDTTALLATFGGVTMDSLRTLLQAEPSPAPLQSTVIAELGDSTYTAAQVLTHARSARLPQQQTVTGQLLIFAEDFLNKAALDYEAAALEERDDEFREVMQEFRDGLILFKLMEDSVWTAAMQDSAAVESYFAAHREDFRFSERTRAIAFRSPSDSLLLDLLADVEAGTRLRALVAQYEEEPSPDVQVDTAIVAGPTSSVYDYALNLDEGEHTQVLRDGNQYAVLFHAGIEPPRLKTLEEARAEVVNAYQSVLEERLLNRLRREYDVTTYPEHLQHAFDAAAATPPSSSSTE